MYFIDLYYSQLKVVQDPKAKEAMQALNAAWEVLKDPVKRQEYNQRIIAAAMSGACRERGTKRLIQLAAKHEKPEKPQKESAKKSTSAKSGNGASASTAADADTKEEKLVYMTLKKQQKTIVIKSSLQKKLSRRFEHQAFAGVTNAALVAKAFSTNVEAWNSDVLTMKKVSDLQDFMEKHDIEKPGKRLSKAELQEYIEEARAANIRSWQQILCIYIHTKWEHIVRLCKLNWYILLFCIREPRCGLVVIYGR